MGDSNACVSAGSSFFSSSSERNSLIHFSPLADRVETSAVHPQNSFPRIEYCYALQCGSRRQRPQIFMNVIQFRVGNYFFGVWGHLTRRMPNIGNDNTKSSEV